MSLLKIKRKGERVKNNFEDEKKYLPLENKIIGISLEAQKKILDLKNNDLQKNYFRIAILGGGCSGLTLHFEFCPEKKVNDLEFKNGEAIVLIDKKSLQILGGSTLHFRSWHESGEFVLLNNPAEKQCSCGKSFSF